jgi:hypothetical protein
VSGMAIHDVYTPYAVHGMDEAMGLRKSRLTWVCFFAGLTGFTCAVALQTWAAVFSWPLNVGGKPFFSGPAFVPVTFELTVLFASLTTVAALFARERLFPGASPKVLPRVTNDRFALALRTEGVGFDKPIATEFMKKHGALECEVVEVDR